MIFLHLLLSLATPLDQLTGKCLRCMNNTQHFLNGQSRFDLSSYEICANANVCEGKTAIGTKEIARIAMKTAIRDTISKVEAEINTNGENNFDGTEEILKLFDTFYDLSSNMLENAIAEDDVKNLLKDVLKKVREVKPSDELRETLSGKAKKARQPVRGFSPAKRFWLWLGEVVLNNETLNNLFKEGFEKLFGVTVDAE